MLRRTYGHEHKPNKQGSLYCGIQGHVRMHVDHERLLQVHELDAGPVQHDGYGNLAGRSELCGGHEQFCLHHRTVGAAHIGQKAAQVVRQGALQLAVGCIERPGCEPDLVSFKCPSSKAPFGSGTAGSAPRAEAAGSRAAAELNSRSLAVK
jgi:hypothetical protein